MKTSFILAILTTVALLALTACAQTPSEDGVTTLRLAHTNAPGDVADQSIDILGEYAEEHAQGRLDIDIYGAGQLGNERDLIEGISLRTVDMILVTNAPMGNFVPEAFFYDLPALYEDLDHVHAVAESPIVTEMLSEALLEQDMRLLAVTDGGFRHITNDTREVDSIEDLAGIKMRVQESPVIQATYEALPGVTPVPVPIGDLYTALEQGVVDGQENPSILTRDFQFNEVLGYMTLTAHSYFPRYLLINDNVWAELPPEDQAVLQAGAERMQQFKNDYYAREDQAAIEDLRSEGMTVVESSADFDDALFSLMQEQVYPQFYEQIGEGDYRKGEETVNEIIELGE